MKGAYLKYINLNRFFAGKSRDNVTLISTDALIYSKNSQHFKGRLGTKEREIIRDVNQQLSIKFLDIDRKKEEDDVTSGEDDYLEFMMVVNANSIIK